MNERRRDNSTMLGKTDYAVVTKKALENGKIGFAYRKQSDGPKDSGWRMMYDRDEDRLDLANPDKVYACDIKKLIKYFPEIKSFLGEKKYTIAEDINGEYVCRKTDKMLSDVPNQMTGKNKYGTLVGGPGNNHGGVIFTADPADMKHGKKEWETLIPEKE